MNFRDIMGSKPQPNTKRQQADYARANAGLTRDLIKEVVRAHPGLQAAELRAFLGGKVSQLPSAARRGHIEVSREDNKYRYYASGTRSKHYLEKKLPVIMDPKPILVNKPTDDFGDKVELAAKAYVWETEDMSLKAFVEWVKRGGTTP